MSKLDDVLNYDIYVDEHTKQQIKDLMLELMEDCKHTINTEDENSWVSWDELSYKVNEL